jgi:hypothetical protein
MWGYWKLAPNGVEIRGIRRCHQATGVWKIVGEVESFFLR